MCGPYTPVPHLLAPSSQSAGIVDLVLMCLAFLTQATSTCMKDSKRATTRTAANCYSAPVTDLQPFLLHFSPPVLPRPEPGLLICPPGCSHSCGHPWAGPAWPTSRTTASGPRTFIQNAALRPAAAPGAVRSSSSTC